MSDNTKITKIELIQLAEKLSETKELSANEYAALISFTHLELKDNNFLIEAKRNFEENSNAVISDIALEDKAKALNKINKIRISAEHDLTTLKTLNWVQIGRMLLYLSDEVETKLGKGHWCNWVKNNLSFSKRRVDQAIKIAVCGDSLRKYYPLGIDRLYTFVNKLLRHGSSEKFIEVARGVGFSDANDVTNPESLCAVKKQVDIINETKFAEKQLDVLFNRASLVKINKLDEHIKKIDEIQSEDGKIEYLKKLIANRGQGMPLKDESEIIIHRRESLISIICKLHESIDYYIKLNMSPSPPLKQLLIEQAGIKIGQLKPLIERLDLLFKQTADQLLKDIN